MSLVITTPSSNVVFGAQGTLELSIIFMSLINAWLHYLNVFLVIINFLFLWLNNVDFEIIGSYVLRASRNTHQVYFILSNHRLPPCLFLLKFDNDFILLSQNPKSAKDFADPCKKSKRK